MRCSPCDNDQSPNLGSSCGSSSGMTTQRPRLCVNQNPRRRNPPALQSACEKQMHVRQQKGQLCGARSGGKGNKYTK